MTDARTNTTTNVYDAKGRVTSQTDRRDKTTHFDYSTPGVTVITDPLGNVTKQHFDENLLTSQTLGFGTTSAATTSYTYDPVSLGTTSVTDDNNHTWTATYDSDGNKLSESDPLSDSESWTYNSFNEPLTYTDANTNTTTNTYDADGNLKTSSTPVDATHTALTQYFYADSANPGSVTSVIDPRNKTTTYTYNSHDEMTSQTDPDGDKYTYTYVCSGCRSHLGVPYTMVTPRGNVTGGTPSDYTYGYTYDDDIELLTETDPHGDTTINTYDADGDLHTVTDRKTHETTYSHNADQELTTTTYPDTTSTTYGYDDDDNRNSFLDGNSRTTTYTYDPLNRLASTTTPGTAARSGGIVTGYTYDGANNLLKLTQPANGGSGTLTTTYGYDHANRLNSISYSDGTTPGVGYTYYPTGTPATMVDGTGTTTYTDNLIGWPTDITDGAGHDVQYGYDDDGDATSIKYPNGQSITRGFDNEDRLNAVTDWNSNTTSFMYSPDNMLKTVNYPNGIAETWTYSHDDAVSDISDKLSTTTLAEYTYTRDADDSPTSITGAGSNPGPTVSTIGYDTLQRLNRYGGSSTNLGYDAADNPTTLDSGRTLNYDNADELTTSSLGGTTTTYSYQDRGIRHTAVTGSTTQTYGYDQANRLTSYSNRHH